MREQIAVISRNDGGRPVRRFAGSGIPIAIAAREIEAIDALIDPPVQLLILRGIPAAPGANDKCASDQNDRWECVDPPFHASISNGRSQARAGKVTVQACNGAPIPARKISARSKG
ncbi:hypothetical protein [Bradyrhizobium mercantei]|uniref:hypothetical protein n=1 Tax=Bradyrhizobium mercantei TaxID=1904807 RepID=UPI00142D8DF0|nr:hypothetical protein [Bradyrhizobium mercantei]